MAASASTPQIVIIEPGSNGGTEDLFQANADRAMPKTVVALAEFFFLLHSRTVGHRGLIRAEDLRKPYDTCKTGNKQNTKQKQQQANKQTKNTNTNDQRQVSLDGETSGEKRVKRPKLSCVELHEEA